MNEKNVIYTLSLGLKKEDVDVTDEAVREAEELIRMIEGVCESNTTVGIVGISKIPGLSLEDDTAVYIDFEADGNETMCVSVLVEGTSKQDKIGISYIDIEQKIGNRWSYFDTLEAADYPDFYDYDSYDYMGDVYFEGTPGVEYRVTVCVYAEKDGGSDSRTVTTNSCVCR